MFSLIVTSCGGSDEESSNVKSDDEMETILQGSSWVSDANYDLLEWGDDASLSKEIVTLFFMGDGDGIGKYYNHEDDTYFGSSSSTKPFSFSYYVSGGNVWINSIEYQYSNNMLVATDGSARFKPSSISSSDRTWLESAQYYVLPDDERLNFEFSHACAEFGTVSEGNKKYTTIDLYLLVDASAKAFSRGVNLISASYKISGGTFSKRPTTNLFISEDADLQASSSTTVTTTGSSQATITATFSMYDYKNNQTITIGTSTYKVPQNVSSEESSTDYKDLIVGKWTVTMDDPTWKCIVTFSSNGTFTSKEYYDEYSDGKFSSFEGSYSGKWTISGSKITITPSDENSVMDFVGTIKSLNSTSGKFTDSDGWSIYLSK